MGLILSLIESTCNSFFALPTFLVMHSFPSSPDRLLVYLFGASGLVGIALGHGFKGTFPVAYHGMLGVMIISLML